MTTNKKSSTHKGEKLLIGSTTSLSPCDGQHNFFIPTKTGISSTKRRVVASGNTKINKKSLPKGKLLTGLII